ncbi:glycosyltransferase family 2 protein [Pseudomonas mosselii]|uniref:glycosyltransferase family 2 protein n=1 Tax=Pseudomonas mosselii TaxID=78327 RepID=UPI000BB52199|nr:glycosyltransferase family 2 protein [Pseudomonas mosselii]ATB64089.1 glycosyl transferase [Pseudomonas mosselii]MDH1099541.1 glycosyltransferase family 2 protein [Pseudomonas mosselii]
MSSNLPQVAVLLAAYNGMSWIEEQLASIQAQHFVDVSIYISVDPSTDGTEAWCVEYARAHSNIHLLPPSGRFGGAARNFFRLIRDVDFSGYDYICFSDQDDIWYPNKLGRAVAKLRAANIDGYSSNVVAFWPNGRRVLVNKSQPQVQRDYLFEAAGPGCTYVFSKPLAIALKSGILQQWDQVQDVAMHDWYCYAFARCNGFNWFIDPVPGMDYRQHENNQLGVNMGGASALSRLRQVARGDWFTQVQLIDSLTCDGKTALPQRIELASCLSFIRLAMRFKACRRRRRDQWLFAALCLFMAAAKPRR